METKFGEPLDDARFIIKRYKIRLMGRDGRTVGVSVPREAFEREVRKAGVPLKEASEKLEAVWRYNGFDGLYLKFEEVEKKEPILLED